MPTLSVSIASGEQVVADIFVEAHTEVEVVYCYMLEPCPGSLVRWNMSD